MNQKSIRITSAGTAAQKSSKSSWLARHALLLAIPMLCAVFCCQAQTKNNTRYFQASYYGQDSTGDTKYGSYYFSTRNNYFPTIEETRTIIIVAYKLKFSPIEKKMTIWLVEFKNKAEWEKWLLE